MPTIDLLLKHRSIRRFTDAPVADSDLERACSAGQAASTSSAVQAYCAIRVRDPERREQLATLCGGQEQVARAGAFLIICGDSRRHRLAVADAQGTYHPCLESFLLATIDATLFAQNMVIALEAMGYGICYIGGLRNDLDAVDKLMQLPSGVFPLFGLTVGIPAESPDPRPRLPAPAVLFDDHYPDDDTMRLHMSDYDATYRAYLTERGANPRGWTDGIARRYRAPQRAPLAAFYRKKGAQLDSSPESP